MPKTNLPLNALDTPCVVIDLDKAEANMARAQAAADAHSIALRPHIKTHKLPYFAKAQVAIGAKGITCQKLGEAEVMAAAGLNDIFLTFNILGVAKLARLKALHQKITIKVVADNAPIINGYGAAFNDPDHPLSVLIECDTGMGRCGVQTVSEALNLARLIATFPGLYFAGLMTYPPRDRVQQANEWLIHTRDMLESAGFAVPIISNGGTPDFPQVLNNSIATEFRPGTYIYSDRMQVSFGHGTLENCALTIMASIVSRPTPNRAIIDAGSKSLGADTCAMPGYGHLVDYPAAVIEQLSEEHGIIDVSACPTQPQIGDKVRIIPNHVCIVSNLFESVHLVRDAVVLKTLPVAARGKLT